MPRLAVDRNTEQQVADVADQRERQQTFNIALRDRAENTDDQRQPRNNHQQLW